MSIQDIYQKVTRHKNITVIYKDVQGIQHSLEATGFLAKCIQHEIDHLNGILFIQRLTVVRATLIRSQLKSLVKKS